MVPRDYVLVIMSHCSNASSPPGIIENIFRTIALNSLHKCCWMKILRFYIELSMIWSEITLQRWTKIQI